MEETGNRCLNAARCGETGPAVRWYPGHQAWLGPLCAEAAFLAWLCEGPGHHPSGRPGPP